MDPTELKSQRKGHKLPHLLSNLSSSTAEPTQMNLKIHENSESNMTNLSRSKKEHNETKSKINEKAVAEAAKQFSESLFDDEDW
jgi:hypothetical protein